MEGRRIVLAHARRGVVLFTVSNNGLVLIDAILYSFCSFGKFLCNALIIALFLAPVRFLVCGACVFFLQGRPKKRLEPDDVDGPLLIGIVMCHHGFLDAMKRKEPSYGRA